MTTEQHRPDADGVLEGGDAGNVVLRFTRRLAHPVERVWTALTSQDELIRWWGDADVDLTEGGAFTLRWLNADEHGNRAVLHAAITRLDPPRLLELTGDLHGVLRWELRSDAGGTVLTFSSTLQLPAEYRTMTLAGWHFHLDALAAALDGRTTDLAGVGGWAQIHDRYRTLLA